MAPLARARHPADPVVVLPYSKVFFLSKIWETRGLQLIHYRAKATHGLIYHLFCWGSNILYFNY